MAAIVYGWEYYIVGDKAIPTGKDAKVLQFPTVKAAQEFCDAQNMSEQALIGVVKTGAFTIGVDWEIAAQTDE